MEWKNITNDGKISTCSAKITDGLLAYTTITFPRPFKSEPIVSFQLGSAFGPNDPSIANFNVSNTGITAYINNAKDGMFIHLIAIGELA